MDKILVIVEGAKTEIKFIKRLIELTGDDIITVSYNNNIYNLYKCLYGAKDNEFQSDDTVRMLIYGDNNVNETDKQKLKNNINNIPYIYLIFDFDYQNCKHLRKIEQELNKIRNLVSYFNDETGGRGKILINYPMMESFKDMPDISDNSFIDLFVRTDFGELTNYKRDVSIRGVKKDILKYTKFEFYEIAKMNLIKINKLLFNKKAVPYRDDYFRTEAFSQAAILEKQIELLKNSGNICVINSGILLYVDLCPSILKNGSDISKS